MIRQAVLALFVATIATPAGAWSPILLGSDGQTSVQVTCGEHTVAERAYGVQIHHGGRSTVVSFRRQASLATPRSVVIVPQTATCLFEEQRESLPRRFER
jgi:hypothetical protein